jgi:hypothetical protein
MADNPYAVLNEHGLERYHTKITQYITDTVNASIAVFCNTTAGWNAQPQFIGKAGCIYIYTDYKQNDQHQDIAGIKIGDGQAYLIDAPFIDEMLYDHLSDTTRHITDAERTFWNNKVRCYVASNNPENLIFTTN